MSEPEPPRCFADSRRLTGANRYFAGTGITLTPLGPMARDADAHGHWVRRFGAMAAALGWPEPHARAVVATQDVYLVAQAPEDRLFTATDVAEWAWECCVAEAGEAGAMPHVPAQPGELDTDRAALEFARRAAAERKPALGALRDAARVRRLPVFVDDDAVSIGAGTGSRTWPLSTLPGIDAVPWELLHDIPTALVTGSNGKTTTVRLVAAMLAASGRVPGLCSTTGIEVDGVTLNSGDYAGPAGARDVLRHPEVQAAVLETARGGILRRGLAVQRADVAVVTNISADHFGEYGVESLRDLAEVKLVVAHAVQDGAALVLNADDALLVATADALPHAAHLPRALFAADHDHPALQALRLVHGATCGVADDELVLSTAGRRTVLGRLAELPLTHAGSARHNVANLAAAALAAWHLGVGIEAIVATARRFGRHPLDNPGRLERWDFRGATVLVDYAHNPDGLAQLLQVARRLHPRRLTLLLGQAGNRSDAAIADLARAAASFAPDRVVLKDMGETYRRGRAAGEVPALLRAALMAAGMPESAMACCSDEETGARDLVLAAEPGDVVVLPVHEALVRERLARWLAAGPQASA